MMVHHTSRPPGIHEFAIGIAQGAYAALHQARTLTGEGTASRGQLGSVISVVHRASLRGSFFVLLAAVERS
jgi:hypothetical protein